MTTYNLYRYKIISQTEPDESQIGQIYINVDINMCRCRWDFMHVCKKNRKYFVISNYSITKWTFF